MTSGEGDAVAFNEGAFRRDIPSSVVLAHELKSPLALIRQLTFELGRDDLEPADRTRLTEQMRLTTERALRFTSSIAASEATQQSMFATSPTSATAACRQVLHEIQPLYEAHGRVLKFSRKSRDYLGVANPDLLHRILMNFADNALEYSDPDSVVELFASLQRREGKVRLGVRDRLGAAPRRQGVRPHRVTQYDRHGLGLMISQRFAGQFGGTVGAIRHRDGVSFFVDLDTSKQLALL